MSCSNCNGCGCSSCRVCPTADNSLPDTCEFLQAIPIGTTVVVEDSAGCKRSLLPPSSTSLLQQTQSGDIDWVDGSEANPLCLPNTQLQAGGTIPGVLALNDSGCVVDYSADSPADLQVLIQDGADIKFESLSTAIVDAAGDGCGVLVRDCDPADSEISFATGTEGQVLTLDADLNAHFVDPSELTAASAFIDTQAIYATYSSGSTAIVGFGQLVVADGAAKVFITNTASKVLNLAANGAGGLDVGSLAASTYYYIFAIYDKDNDIINVMASLSATAPTMPGTFTYFRVIGLFRTTGTSFLAPGYFQNGRRVFLGETAAVTVMTQGTTASNKMYTGAVSGLAPYQYVNEAMFRIGMDGATTAFEVTAIIADQVAAATGAPVSLPVGSNQYGSTNATATTATITVFSSFTVIVPFAAPSYYNIYLSAVLGSGDTVTLLVVGYTLTLF